MSSPPSYLGDPKQAAHVAVTVAIREGRMRPANRCEACAASSAPGRRQRFVWHHWSYAPEHQLDVIPLCVPCHWRVHHGDIAEPRTGRVYERPVLAMSDDERRAQQEERARTQAPIVATFKGDLTDVEVARRIGVARNTLSKWRAGTKELRPHHVVKLAGLATGARRNR